MKTLLTFASRSLTALKGRLGVPVMAGVLALALAVAPLPAMAMEVGLDGLCDRQR